MPSKRKVLAIASAGIAAGAATVAAALRKTKRMQEEARAKGAHVPYGPYEAVVKRPLDVVLSTTALVALSPIMAATALAVKAKLGSPVIFKQLRPGLNEELFEIYKFRTMTNERDAEGNLLPDTNRLTPFGAWLRFTSIDELPELVNIVKGEMSFAGPRPQLVRDMVFMTDEQRRRHVVVPGLSGLAQVNGRNSITWDEKLAYDLEYIDSVSFLGDAAIVLKTMKKVLLDREGITEEGEDTATDLGDYLLANNQLTQAGYDEKQQYAQQLLQTRA